MLKKFIFSLCFIFGFTSVANANIDTKDPYKMVTAVAEQTFTKLKNNQDKINDINFRKNLINNELLPYVDVKYAAYKVIGTNLKQTTEQQREEFTKAFSQYIVATYADALGSYKNQELVAPNYKKVSDSESLISVKFLIRESNKPDLELVFKLRKNSKTNEWKAFDMIAENISMLDAKTSELSPLIKSKGIDSVIELLQEHNKKLSSQSVVAK